MGKKTHYETNLSLDNMTGEVWKPVEGYEGLYEVSNKGRVKSLAKKWKSKDHVRQPACNNGYLEVALVKDKRSSIKQVHRLVAKAFCQKRNGCNFVDHINNIRSDNRAENLRWVTHEENMNNPLTKAVISERGKGRKKPFSAREKLRHQSKCRPVVQISDEGFTVATFISPPEAERKTGICCQNIHRCAKHIVAHAGGFRWEYI